MFATDRDLLILEPNLFRDIGWAGQRLLETTGSSAGTTLTITTGDAAAVGISAGHVALVNATPLEVVQRLSATQLQVSRLRATPDAPVIPPPALSAQPIVISTFAPQLALVHAHLMGLLGIDPPMPPGAEPIAEAQITNPRALCLLESLGALSIILSAAAALSGPDSPLGRRAESYRQRYTAERHRAVALIDLDHDGTPDAIRRFDVMRLARV